MKKLYLFFIPLLFSCLEINSFMGSYINRKSIVLAGASSCIAYLLVNLSKKIIKKRILKDYKSKLIIKLCELKKLMNNTSDSVKMLELINKYLKLIQKYESLYDKNFMKSKKINALEFKLKLLNNNSEEFFINYWELIKVYLEDKHFFRANKQNICTKVTTAMSNFSNLKIRFFLLKHPGIFMTVKLFFSKKYNGCIDYIKYFVALNFNGDTPSFSAHEHIDSKGNRIYNMSAKVEHAEKKMLPVQEDDPEVKRAKRLEKERAYYHKGAQRVFADDGAFTHRNGQKSDEFFDAVERPYADS